MSDEEIEMLETTTSSEPTNGDNRSETPEGFKKTSVCSLFQRRSAQERNIREFQQGKQDRERRLLSKESNPPQHPPRSSFFSRLKQCLCFKNRRGSQASPIPDIAGESQFEKLIQETEGLLVVHFYDNECWVCVERTNQMKEWVKEFPKVTFMKIHTDQYPNVMNVTRHCVIVFYKNGEEVHRCGMNELTIRTMVEKLNVQRKLSF